MLTEVRWHGRGGQGVVTVSELLARAALLENKYVQHFPEFGPERMGAPIKAYTRIDVSPIDTHSGVYEPNVVIVIDPTLLKTVPVVEGLKVGGVFIVNIAKSPEELMDELRLKEVKAYTVNATRIALDIFKKPFFNTPMLGSLIKATKLVSLNSAFKAVRERFSGDFADRNIEAIKRAYEEVKGP